MRAALDWLHVLRCCNMLYHVVLRLVSRVRPRVLRRCAAQVRAGGRTYAPTMAFAGGALRRLARTAIIHLSFKELARAVTIAVRYSAVRRQVLPYGKGLRGAEVGESTHDRGCGLRLAGVQGFDG